MLSLSRALRTFFLFVARDLNVAWLQRREKRIVFSFFFSEFFYVHFGLNYHINGGILKFLDYEKLKKLDKDLKIFVYVVISI